MRPLPPELHNRPERIRAAVERGGRRATTSSSRTPTADARRARRAAGGSRAPHCYELFGGARADDDPGTYYLTDFLVRSFDRVVVRGLGLDRHPELRDDYFRHYTRVVWLAQRPTAELREQAERAAATPRPSARGARDRRARASRPRLETTLDVGGGDVLINRDAALRDPLRGGVATLDGGWRRIVSELGVEFLAATRRSSSSARPARTSTGSASSSTRTSCSSRSRKAPREFDLQARNPERSVHIGGDHMVFSPVYGCPFIRDGLERRDATLADFQNLARLAQAFPQLDSVGRDDLRAERRAARLASPRHGLQPADALGQAVHGLGHVGPERGGHDRDGRDGVRARVDRADALRDLADQRQLAAPLRRPHARSAVRVRAREPAA